MRNHHHNSDFVASAVESAERIDRDRRALTGLAASSFASVLFGLHPTAAQAADGIGIIGASQAQPAAPGTASVSPWWPSKWGKDDQIGATNLITPAKILDALKLVKAGKLYEMSHVYESSMPMWPRPSSCVPTWPISPATNSSW